MTSSTNAEEFLRTLPRDECPICKEPYGQKAPDTGIKEHAVRLPCDHVVGRECIAMWLAPESNKNTCPLCREEFFPVQPLPFRPLPFQPMTFEDNEGYLISDITNADHAVELRLMDGESWSLQDLRAWLRVRLGPNPPSTFTAGEDWWHHGRHQAPPTSVVSGSIEEEAWKLITR